MRDTTHWIGDTSTHGCRQNNGPFDTQFLHLAARSLCSEEDAVDVDVIKLSMDVSEYIISLDTRRLLTF